MTKSGKAKESNGEKEVLPTQISSAFQSLFAASRFTLSQSLQCHPLPFHTSIYHPWGGGKARAEPRGLAAAPHAPSIYISMPYGVDGIGWDGICWKNDKIPPTPPSIH